jgi:hypothetical protein
MPPAKKRTRKKTAARTKGATPIKRPVKDLALPDEPKDQLQDLLRYVILIYGRQGVGKSTWAASAPDCLMLSTERVSKHLQCYDFNTEDGGPGVSDWRIFRKAVSLLKKTDRFKAVAIDTVAAAYEHCSKYVCDELGIGHPSEAGYGKAWSAVRHEFVGMLREIIATGRGLIMTAHMQTKEIESFSGMSYTRIQPDMTGQAYSIIKAITDFTLYAEFAKDTKGNDIRVLITEGDEIVDAKRAIELPKFLPLEKEGGFDLVQKAVHGQAPKIDVMPSKQTQEEAADLLRSE